jgi:hypothetical protein
MNNQFDELAKGLAQSVTRRQAFKRFGVGLAGMVLACFGLGNKAVADKPGCLPEGSICVVGGVPCCGGLKCKNTYLFGYQCVKGTPMPLP